MRSALVTIQQTLTPEAATILNQSIAEACRRNHGHTTPLHVAAALLSSPSGLLRQACIRSHPNSSHPLQCRALELCFSVALERLSTAQSSAPEVEPPISNALMAALKRAQAQQRRGCPEQQQQSLLAAKVGLDQLIVSILDDPSISRVMKEAGFSSPAVKSASEQSFKSSNSFGHQQHHSAGMKVNFGPRTAPVMHTQSPTVPLDISNPYLNPRSQSGPKRETSNQNSDEVNNVLEIMSRSKKRNPILVGDSEPEVVLKELVRRIENKEFRNDGVLENVTVVSMEKELLSYKNQTAAKMKELSGVIESRMLSGGVILDLGDLRWLLEQPQQAAVAEMGRIAVTEMAALFARFMSDDQNKLWLIGTATCETYLRCQVYHSTMENDLDLQAVPIDSRSPLPRLFPRPGTESSVESLCPRCLEDYEKELVKLVAIQKSFSEASQPSLPQWLQNAKLNTSDSKTADDSQVKDDGPLSEQKTRELQKKRSDLCLHLHPHFHQNNRTDRPTLSVTSLCNPNLHAGPLLQHKLLATKPVGDVLQLSSDRATDSPSESQVRTDLVLGRKGTDVENQPKDFLGCTDKFSNTLDADTYKNLLNGLLEKAWWQSEAAFTLASAITRCRFGNGKRRRGASRGDVWLLFAGPDRAGKKKMATVIAEKFCGTSPIMICLGTRKDDEVLDKNSRGKTATDRIAETVRRNPFSVIMLQDIDEANPLVRGNVIRAINRGRVLDSRGCEVGFGNTIFILTGDWSGANPKVSGKRRGSWSEDDDRPLKCRKKLGPRLSLDLNLATLGAEDERANISPDSSDDEDQHFAITLVPRDLLSNVDESIVFKPVDSALVQREIKKTIASKFSMMVDDSLSLEIEDDVLERILGGIWLDRTGLEEWIEKERLGGSAGFR